LQRLSAIGVFAPAKQATVSPPLQEPLVRRLHLVCIPVQLPQYLHDVIEMNGIPRAGTQLRGIARFIPLIRFEASVPLLSNCSAQ
jgi:hypothetical protein